MCVAFALGWINCAFSGQIANVEYIHKLIEKTWNIWIPYAPDLTDVHQAANMKYLMHMVDVTNAKINGYQDISSNQINYSTDLNWATTQAVDTTVVSDAINRLITQLPGFTIVTTPDTASFSFKIRAKGNFTVYWGDGQTTNINRTSTSQYIVPAHQYASPGRYVIRITGTATEYVKPASVWVPEEGTISFADNLNVAEIHGDLSDIFPTIIGAAQPQPRFTMTFSGCTNLGGTLPPNLFEHIHGVGVTQQYSKLFLGCAGLTGSIPHKFFGDITGAPQIYQFGEAFSGCSGLTGSVPGDLFEGMSGTSAGSWVGETFLDCSGLTGYVPAELFGERFTPIASDPYSGWANTFSRCPSMDSECPAGTVAAPKPYDGPRPGWSDVAVCRKL